MSSANSQTYENVSKPEANDNNAAHLERLRTPGGHPDDRTQPSLPIVHRSFANPAPLGLLSFATGMEASLLKVSLILITVGIFLISMFGVQARGIATPNVLIGVLIFFVVSANF